MQKVFLRFVSFFLVLAIASTFIPIEVFHQAQHSHEHLHCDADNPALEKDACHISIYHGNQNNHVCDHESHLINGDEECELCKFITVKRVEGVIFNPQTITKSSLIKTSATYQLVTYQLNRFNPLKGRAPPTT